MAAVHKRRPSRARKILKLHLNYLTVDKIAGMEPLIVLSTGHLDGAIVWYIADYRLNY